MVWNMGGQKQTNKSVSYCAFLYRQIFDYEKHTFEHSCLDGAYLFCSTVMDIGYVWLEVIGKVQKSTVLVLSKFTSASSSWWTNLIPSAPFSCIRHPFIYVRSDELFRYMPYPGRKYYRSIIIMKTLEIFQFIHITWTHHTFNLLLSSYLMTIMQYK